MILYDPLSACKSATFLPDREAAYALQAWAYTIQNGIKLRFEAELGRGVILTQASSAQTVLPSLKIKYGFGLNVIFQ